MELLFIFVGLKPEFITATNPPTKAGGNLKEF